MAKIVILGAYGLIGAACLRALRAEGHDICPVGRDARAARAVAPDLAWKIVDLRHLDQAGWQDLLAGADAVVNAAGALQDGAADDVAAIHLGVAHALSCTAGPETRIVQISAVGVKRGASTAFYRTKAQADAAIRAAASPWVILRPGLVFGASAYGGTALLRAAAGLPGLMPRLLPDVRVQTVAVEDVAQAVLWAIQRDNPSGIAVDLVEPEDHSLPDLIATLRNWLGLPRAWLTVPVPTWALRGLGWGADLLGHLGWRSPLRSTATRVLEEGVTGDPQPWQQISGISCRPLAQTLATYPATLQERWFARLWLMLPLCVAVLSAFWLLSGVIALAQIPTAQAVLTDRGYGSGFARTAVIGGAILDIGLGSAILWRPWARAACLGMIVTATAYLLAGSTLTPDLWSDPLGPLVKILPAITLPAVTAALLERR